MLLSVNLIVFYKCKLIAKYNVQNVFLGCIDGIICSATDNILISFSYYSMINFDKNDWTRMWRIRVITVTCEENQF